MAPRRATTKQEVSVGRFIIPFRIYGNAGSHLVCLNGAQQSMAMWHGFAQYFSPSYRIVLFDFPGQGKAQIVDGPATISLDEQVEVLHCILEAAEVGADATLCTASWGGVIALLFVVKYPSLVKRLILAGIGTRPNPKMVETIKKGLSIDIKNRSEMADVLIKSFGQNLPEAIKRKITKQFHQMSEENLRAFCEHGSFVLSAESLSDFVDFKKVPTETVLLRGEHDTIIDLHDAHLLADKIPNCTIKIVEGVGHFLHLESEDIFSVYQEVLEGGINGQT